VAVEAKLSRAAELSPSHELCRVFADHGFVLNDTLHEMLGEHFSHRTERRGCGFTQSTRHLAVLVNRPRDARQDVVAKLFPRWVKENAGESAVRALQSALRELPSQLQFEESKLLAAIIADLVQPSASDDAVGELPPYYDEIKVGTCPLAEKYFLEIADRFVRRKGRVNILISQTGEPLLVEKLNLGDDHSCISLTELTLNGVRLPAGCLFGARYDGDPATRVNQDLPGHVIRVSDCLGFRFLRLTTLAVSPENRERAFSAHFQSQVDAGLFAPRDTTIEQLRSVAQEQV